MTILHCNKQDLMENLEKKFLQQCSERDSRSYQTLYFSFPEEFRVVATRPNFYQNRVPLLNIKEGTHDKSKHQTFRFFPKKNRAVDRRLCLGGQCLAQKSFPSRVAARKFCFGLLWRLGACSLRKFLK